MYMNLFIQLLLFKLNYILSNLIVLILKLNKTFHFLANCIPICNINFKFKNIYNQPTSYILIILIILILITYKTFFLTYRYAIILLQARLDYI